MSVQHIRDVGVALPAHIEADGPLECAANPSKIVDREVINRSNNTRS
jgi:hypothetical protein